MVTVTGDQRTNSTSRGLQSLLNVTSSSNEVLVTYFQNSDQDYVYSEYLNFNQTLEWWDSRTYVVELDFAKPEYVSADSRTPDLVKIDFTLNTAFMSEAGVPMQ